MSAEIKIKVGKDDKGDYIDHQLYFDNMAETQQRITRQYYEEVDKAIIENMPEALFNDICDKVEDKHHLLIHEAKQMLSATPLAIPERPKDLQLKYWKYQTNPMINKIANYIVSYMLTKELKNEN